MPTQESQSAASNREQEIRLRACTLYEERGREDGHNTDDWLRAEAEFGATAQKAAASLELNLTAPRLRGLSFTWRTEYLANLSGRTAVMSMLDEPSGIHSAICFPVTGPRVSPFIACPVATNKPEYRETTPTAGRPSGKHGLKPHHSESVHEFTS